MSVNDRNNQNNQSKPAATGSNEQVFGESFQGTAGSQNAGASAGRPQSGRANLGNALGLRGAERLQGLRTGMGRKRGSADLQKLRDTLMESFASFTNSQVIPEAQNFKLIIIDRNRLNKKVDLLVAVLPVNIGGTTHAAIHTLLLEDANDKYDPITMQIAGQTKYYSTVVSDVYSQDLWGTIVQFVSNEAGVNLTPYDAGHQTLPAELDVTDKDTLHQIAFFVTEALVRTTMNSITKSNDDIVSLDQLDENTVAQATIDFTNVNSRTAAGLPLRADFDVQLRYSQPTKSGESQTEKSFDLGSSMPLGGAQGFVDITYVMPPAPGFGQQQKTQLYKALIVLTRLDTAQDFITPELQLLALAGSTLISRNMNWARVWSQQFRAPGTDLNDIGAVGYELQLAGNAERIDTTSAAFDDVALAKLVQLAIDPKPVMMFDVEESGELSWLNRILLDAANGSVDAGRSIIQAADNLTGGKFSQQWNGGATDLVVDDGNRIHLGYYTDHNGDKRDIRDLSYLSVLNRFGEQDLSVVEKWQETFDAQDIDAEVRLADREALIRKILGPTVRITGYARRLVFAPDLLDCLLDAAGEAGLRIRPENTLVGFGTTAQRGRSFYESMGYGGQGGRNTFSFSAGGNGRGFNRQFTGRGSWRG
ncbi:hypothetical protein LUCX_59 [Xanthomonas phage vB_XciM_LucasX]|nr:hypothetical protein LUCX_59 [Xanthomonas phage vB_XciM_LucasX]